ncbi:uncharacterized protein HaLaN_25065, partial [Haematococcus lacustris]
MWSSSVTQQYGMIPYLLTTSCPGWQDEEQLKGSCAQLAKPVPDETKAQPAAMPTGQVKGQGLIGDALRAETAALRRRKRGRGSRVEVDAPRSSMAEAVLRDAHAVKTPMRAQATAKAPEEAEGVGGAAAAACQIRTNVEPHITADGVTGRPDYGTVGQPVDVYVNHFKIADPPVSQVVYQFDVAIEKQRAPGRARGDP